MPSGEGAALPSQPGEADRFDVERRWLAAQAPVSVRD